MKKNTASHFQFSRNTCLEFHVFCISDEEKRYFVSEGEIAGGGGRLTIALSCD